MSAPLDPVIVVGGGASGTILAAELLRQAPAVAVVLVEPRPRLGGGVAFGDAAPIHRLNVRAGRMSARADDADHFVRWLAQHDPGAGEGTFARRSDYGRYLAYTLDQARLAAPGSRVAHVRDGVRSVEATGTGYRVVLDAGPALRARTVVLALGNLPPAGLTAPRSAELEPHRFVSDPWTRDGLQPRSRDESVLLLGTGLTAVDVALARHDHGQRGPIVALSRHGLLPRVQAERQPRLRETAVPPSAPTAIPPTGTPPWARAAHGLRALTRALRAEVRRATSTGGDWRDVFEALRPAAPLLWAGLSHRERRAFARHLQSWWDVHRHRMPAETAAGIERLVEAGQLEVRAGRVLCFAPGRRDVRVVVAPRGSRRTVTLHVSRVIDCTGPAPLARARHELLDRLVENGLVRPDPLGLGLDALPDGTLLRGDGGVARGLYAMGPLLRGVLWETTAIPEIRTQAVALARRLAAGLGAIAARESAWPPLSQSIALWTTSASPDTGSSGASDSP